MRPPLGRCNSRSHIHPVWTAELVLLLLVNKMLHPAHTRVTARHNASPTPVNAPTAVALAPHRPEVSRKPARHMQARALGDLATPEAVDATTAAYVGLGLAGLSFIGTFVVAPRFKESFKEDIDWKDMYPELVKSGIKSVRPAEAYAKRKRSVKQHRYSSHLVFWMHVHLWIAQKQPPLPQ